MNFHLFFDPETQTHLPLVERYPWLVYPGVAVAELGAEMAAHNNGLETSIDHWLLTLTRLATAIVAVVGAFKSVTWAINHRKNSAFNRATKVLTQEHENKRRHENLTFNRAMEVRDDAHEAQKAHEKKHHHK